MPVNEPTVIEPKAMSASEYRKLLEAKKQAKPTEFVTCPTGMVFEMVRPDIQAWIVTGRYPQSLVQEGLKVLRDKGLAPTDPEAIRAIGSNLDKDEFNDALIFIREMVRESIVRPRMVLGAQGDDEIEPGEVDIDDFNHLVSWCLNYKGVTNVEGVRTFRAGRKEAARPSTNGKKLQRKTVKRSKNRV